MNSSKENRNRRPARLLTALLGLAFCVGFASVGQAQAPASLVITTQRPVYTDFSSSIRDEMRESTQTTVWMTRIKVHTDLDMKFGQSGRKYLAARADLKIRG